MSKLKDQIAYLYEKNQISYQAKLQANALLTPNLEWARWIVRFSLTIGVALFLTGIVFFFAYNWQYLSDFQKFLTVEISMVVSFVGYFFSPKNNPLIAKLFLMTLSVLVGVFLAVFGQIYQTGADTYQLFLMWAFLISGFVALSQFQGLWILWLILINVGMVLWLNLTYMWQDNYLCLLSYLSILNILALLGREKGANLKIDWLRSKWLRYALLVMVLGLQVPGAFVFFLGENVKVLPSALIYIATFIGLGYLYQLILKDIQAISLLIFSVFVVGEALLFNIFSGGPTFQYVSVFFLMGISTVALIVLVVKLLRIAKQKMGESSHE